MRINSLLILLLITLPGCASRVWTEETDVTRPTGPVTERTENVVLAEEFFGLRTAAEVDGYLLDETVNTDDEGNLTIDLLPPALQALTYGHNVTVELYSFREEKVAWSRTISDEEARRIVREWSVQAELGAEVRLRKKQADLLDRAIETILEPEVRDNLESIRLKVTIRPDWE